MKKPLLAISCLVYNQEPYIQECLNGIAMQKTNFPFVAVVHDDCSTDKSAQIIREYVNKYPTIFIPLYETKNQWSKQDGSLTRIMTEAIDATEAKYVAFCEGDDFWTDPLKLQKQVDFLETHLDYGLVFTHARSYIHEEKRFETELKGKPIESFEQLLLANTISTLTVVARRDLITQYYRDIQPTKQNWLMGDYPLWLYCVSKMKIHFIPDITATYRILANSASHSTDWNKVVQFCESTHDIQMFFAERENISPSLLHKINNAYEERVICHTVHASPSKAAKRLKKAKYLTVWQRLIIWMKIIRMSFLFKIGRNY